MDRLVKEYSHFLKEVAPENQEEIVYSSYLNKWMQIMHCRNSTPSVTVIESEVELAKDFLHAVAFHTYEKDGFKEADIFKQMEMVREEMSSYTDLLSQYIEITSELINEICSDLIESMYK